MQRSRPATGVGTRGAAPGGRASTTGTSTSTSTSTSTRSRSVSEKASSAKTATSAAKSSKPSGSRSKTSTVSALAPGVRKRYVSSASSTGRTSAAVNNQEELPQPGEDNDNGVCSEAASVSSTSDAATVEWLIGSDYRLVTAVRVRPMLPVEKKKGYRRIVEMSSVDEGGWTRIINPVALTSPLSPPSTMDSKCEDAPVPPPASKQFTHEFAFDHSFWSYDHAPGRQVATQGVVYESVGALAIETVLRGSNCAILAYGQSGTGKTFTMTGGGPIGKVSSSAVGTTSRAASNRILARGTGAAAPSSGSGASRQGLAPRICRGLFDRLEELQQGFGDKSVVHVSYVEVYNERVYDLLLASAGTKRTQEPLKVREHPEQGTYVENARQVKATTLGAVQALLDEGNRQRSVTSTSANGRSSRSHAVMTLTLAHQTPPPLSAGKEGQSATVKKSKLYLVDLAGSERADATETNSSRQREASSINRSLATLADVIGALARRSAGSSSTNGGAPFVPYRNSVLTRLLKESLGGDATTVLLATISPCCAHYEDTLSTLKFVGRAKSALSVPKLPSSSPSPLDPTTSELSEVSTSGLDVVHELRKEILELKEKLDAPARSELRRPSFALAWESPSPDALSSRPASAFKDCGSCRGDANLAPGIIDAPSSALVDAVADATRWALQCAPAPMMDGPHQSHNHREHSEIDAHEKEQLEQEIAELQATLSRKEYEFECQRVTTRALQDRVSAQILSQHLVLSNLLYIRRRWLQLQAVRAFQRWRANTHDTKCPEKRLAKCEDAEIQTDSPQRGETQLNALVCTPPATQLNALYHSVVGDFVFTAAEQAQTCEPAEQKERDLASTDYDEAQQEAMDCNTLRIMINDVDASCDLESGNSPGESHADGAIDAATHSTGCGSSSGTFSADVQQSMEMKLTSCLDSIDLARKAIGPTIRKLRQQADSFSSIICTSTVKGRTEDGAIGAERSLLVNADKRLVTMSQIVEAMQDGLAQRSMCTVNHGASAFGVLELMETLVSAFCLHTLGRVNDQLVSGASGCTLGRQEIEAHVKTFREQLARLIQFANAVMARGELHPRDHDAVLLLSVELAGFCERVECVWISIEQRKRHQLMNRRLSSASAFENEQLGSKIRLLETNAIALNESLDAHVLEIARIEDELASATEQLHQKEETHAAQVAALEIQLTECEERASELEKSKADVLRIVETQSSRNGQLEQQLAELTNSLQAMHEAQDGTTASDESSPITLRCGSLMVRLEEELTSALCRMNAIDPVCESPAITSPLTSVRVSPSASPLMKEYNMQLAAINSELSELSAEKEMEQHATLLSHAGDDEPSSEGDVVELKAAMERDLVIGSVHEYELKTQLAEALNQVSHLQSQHEALLSSVHTLNYELSEALARVASLEEERQLGGVDSGEAEEQCLLAREDSRSALVSMEGKATDSMQELAELNSLRSCLRDVETKREVAEAERANLASRLVEEQARCQELTRQVEGAVGNLTELRGQAATLRADLESALHCKQHWEVQTQEKDAEIASQAAQLRQLEAVVQKLEVEVGGKKESQHAQALKEDAAVSKMEELKLEYEERIASLEALVVSKTTIVDSLSEQLSTLQDDSRTELEQLSQCLSKKVAEVEEAEKRHAELLEASTNEQERINKLHQELHRCEEKMDDLKGELETTRRQAAFGEESAASLRAELELSSQTSRMLSDELKRVQDEHNSTKQSAEQQIADLQGEADLLRLLLRSQQAEVLKNQAEREEERAELESAKSALTTALDQFEQLNGKFVSLECHHGDQVERNRGVDSAAQAASADSREWKEAWTRSIAQCGILKLQLTAESIEKVRIEKELHRMEDAMEQLHTNHNALQSELRESNEVRVTLEDQRENLSISAEQLRKRIIELQDQNCGLESYVDQRETDTKELKVLLTHTEEEKRNLQISVEQLESALQVRQAEYATAMEEYALCERELEARGVERVTELEATLVTRATDAREKEAALQAHIEQMNTLVEELKSHALGTERELEEERERVRSLTSALQRCQAEIADRDTLVTTLQGMVDARNASIANLTAETTATTIDLQKLKDQCKMQRQELDLLETECGYLRGQHAQTKEWKGAWSRSIIECGTLLLRVTTTKADALRADQALSTALSRAMAQDVEVELLRSELRRAQGISSELEAESRQCASQLGDAQSEIHLLTVRTQHFESELFRLEQVCRGSEQKEQKLREQAEKSLARICELETILSDQTASQAALVKELETSHLAKEKQFEQSIALASQASLEQNALWQQKEAQLQAQAVDLKGSVQQLVRQVEAANGQLVKEQKNTDKLTLEIENMKTALAECEATNVMLREQFAQQSDLFQFVKSSRDEAEEQYQSLKACCSKLQADLTSVTTQNQEFRQQITAHRSERAAEVAAATEQFSQRLKEMKATASMQLAELESFRWWIATHSDRIGRRSSAELLDQAVAAYNVEPSEETKRAVMQHLTSLDEWFEKTIVGGSLDGMASHLLVAPSTSCGIVSSSVDSPLPAEIGTGSTYLESLTNELLELCAVIKPGDTSRTDTVETIRMSSIAETEAMQEEDNDEDEAALSTEFEDVFGEFQATTEPPSLGNNNTGDGGDSETHESTGDDHKAETSSCEPESSASDVEIAHLKSTIWRLKEVLDSKDDMLGFMDAKLSYYEQLLGKHQDPNRQQQQQQRRATRSMNAGFRR